MSEPTVNTHGILASMKLMLGMEPDYNAFDTDLIIHINTCLAELYQVGVGTEPFQLDLTNPETSEWEDFIGNEELLKSSQAYCQKFLHNRRKASR